MRQLISHDDLKKALFYNAEVGAFYWLHGVAFRSAGKRAGHAESTGRGRRITIDGVPYREHRLAWFYVHGAWPTCHLDHINRDPMDNRIVNLREATVAQNAWNRKRSKNLAKSGHEGVVKSFHKWTAIIRQNGQHIFLGNFDTKQGAACAVADAREKMRGKFVPGAVAIPPRPSVPESIKLPRPVLTQEKLKSMLDYDEATGLFRWKVGFARAPVGSIAGKAWNGHVQIGVLGKLYYANRLAWFYVHGRWPKEEIDHINGDSTDDRISNLREATRTQNLANRRVQTRSMSGIKGIERTQEGRWAARICIGGKRFGLGVYDTPEGAGAAYAAAAREFHGEFARP